MTTLSRAADLQPVRMVGLVKLRCSAGHLAERPQWAGCDNDRPALALWPLGHFQPLYQCTAYHFGTRWQVRLHTTAVVDFFDQ